MISGAPKSKPRLYISNQGAGNAPSLKDKLDHVNQEGEYRFSV